MTNHSRVYILLLATCMMAIKQTAGQQTNVLNQTFIFKSVPTRNVELLSTDSDVFEDTTRVRCAMMCADRMNCTAISFEPGRTAEQQRLMGGTCKLGSNPFARVQKVGSRVYQLIKGFQRAFVIPINKVYHHSFNIFFLCAP